MQFECYSSDSFVGQIMCVSFSLHFTKQNFVGYMSSVVSYEKTCIRVSAFYHKNCGVVSYKIARINLSAIIHQIVLLDKILSVVSYKKTCINLSAIYHIGSSDKIMSVVSYKKRVSFSVRFNKKNFVEQNVVSGMEWNNQSMPRVDAGEKQYNQIS